MEMTNVRFKVEVVKKNASLHIALQRFGIEQNH